MENCMTTLEKLFEKTEIYVKTSIELYKLEAVYKSANIISSITVKLIMAIVFVLFFLFLNIGMALLIGKYFGEWHYGFFAMALFYMLIAGIILLFQNELIKNPTCNFIIRKTIKKDESE